jgi:hypothetical protein
MRSLADVAKDMHSMQQFAEACKDLSSDQIYILFEDEITQTLRDEITCTFWSTSHEPVRAALHQLGERYCIVSLQAY